MMTNIKKLIKAYADCRLGASAISYGLIAALIGMAIIGGANTFGKTTNAQMQCTADIVEQADTIKNPGKHMKKCVRKESR